MAKGTLRVDEDGTPILVITNQLQLYCRHKVKDGTVTIKIRPTPEFIDELNKRTLELLVESIQNARNEGRKDILAEDVPVFIEV